MLFFSFRNHRSRNYKRGSEDSTFHPAATEITVTATSIHNGCQLPPSRLFSYIGGDTEEDETGVEERTSDELLHQEEVYEKNKELKACKDSVDKLLCSVDAVAKSIDNAVSKGVRHSSSLVDNEFEDDVDDESDDEVVLGVSCKLSSYV